MKKQSKVGTKKKTKTKLETSTKKKMQIQNNKTIEWFFLKIILFS